MNNKLPALLLLTLLAGCNKPAPSEPPPRPALVRVVGEKAAANPMTSAGCCFFVLLGESHSRTNQ